MIHHSRTLDIEIKHNLKKNIVMGFFTLFEKKPTQEYTEYNEYAGYNEYAEDALGYEMKPTWQATESHHAEVQIQSVEDFEDLMNNAGASFDDLLSRLEDLDPELKDTIINRIAGIED